MPSSRFVPAAMIAILLAGAMAGNGPGGIAGIGGFAGIAGASMGEGGSAAYHFSSAGHQTDSLSLPGGVHVLDASMALAPYSVNGSWPLAPRVSLGEGASTLVWAFAGSGYGPLGCQDVFGDNATAALFGSPGGQVSVLLPGNATIRNATVTAAPLANTTLSRVDWSGDALGQFDLDSVALSGSGNGTGASLAAQSGNWSLTSVSDFSGGSANLTSVALLPGSVTLSEKPGWFNTQWKYRLPVQLQSQSVDLTDYQTLIVIDTATPVAAGVMNGSGNDMRICGPDGATPLPFWIECGMNTTATRIWVRVPSIPFANSTTIYVYYDGPHTISLSDGPSTFILFDDFEVDGGWNFYSTQAAIFQDQPGRQPGYYSPNAHGLHLEYNGTIVINNDYGEITRDVSLPVGENLTLGIQQCYDKTGVVPNHAQLLLDNTSLYSMSLNVGTYGWNPWSVNFVSAYSSATIRLRLTMEVVTLANVNSRNSTWDNLTIRKHASVEPTFSLQAVEGMYAPAGHYESMVSGPATGWGKVHFGTVPVTGGAISIRTRSGDTTVPDGTWSPWSAAYTSDGQELISPQAERVQFRLDLSTANTSLTPRVDDLAVEYTYLASLGTMVSPPVVAPGNSSLDAVDVSVSYSGSSPGTLLASVSVDNSNWMPAVAGSPVMLPVNSTHFWVRLLLSGDGLTTPTVSGLNVTWNCTHVPAGLSIRAGSTNISLGTGQLFLPVAVDISCALSAYLSNSSNVPVPDAWGNPMSTLPLGVSFDGASIRLENLRIEYDYTAVIPGLGPFLDAILMGSQGNNSSVAIPMTVSSDSPGSLGASLSFSCDRPPNPASGGVVDITMAEDTPLVVNASLLFGDDGGSQNLAFSSPDSNSSILGFTMVGSTIDLQPALEASGNGSLQIVATDASGLHCAITLRITVQPVNDAPALSLPSEIKVNAGFPLLLDAAPYIHDPDDPISAMVLISDSAEVTASGTNLTANFSIPGRYTVEISAFDGKNGSSQNVTFVVAQHQPPTSSVPDVISLPDNITSVFDLSTWFGAEGPSWHFSWNGNGSLWLNGSNLSIDPAPGTSQEAILSISVVDVNNLSASARVTVQVVACPPAGSFLGPSIDDALGRIDPGKGGEFLVDLLVYQVNGTDPLPRWEMVSSFPAGLDARIDGSFLSLHDDAGISGSRVEVRLRDFFGNSATRTVVFENAPTSSGFPTWLCAGIGAALLLVIVVTIAIVMTRRRGREKQKESHKPAPEVGEPVAEVSYGPPQQERARASFRSDSYATGSQPDGTPGPFLVQSGYGGPDASGGASASPPDPGSRYVPMQPQGPPEQENQSGQPLQTLPATEQGSMPGAEAADQALSRPGGPDVTIIPGTAAHDSKLDSDPIAHPTGAPPTMAAPGASTASAAPAPDAVGSGAGPASQKAPAPMAQPVRKRRCEKCTKDIKDDSFIECTCGKSYHEKCVVEISFCPECGADFRKIDPQLFETRKKKDAGSVRIEVVQKTVGKKAILCNLCRGYLKPGMNYVACNCGKAYHEQCARRAGECQCCSTKFESGDGAKDGTVAGPAPPAEQAGDKAGSK